MRILHLTLGYTPAFALGGPVKSVRTSVKELQKRGHQVTVVCTNWLDKHHNIQQGSFSRFVDGIEVHYLDTWRFPWWPGTIGPFYAPGLKRLLIEKFQGIDVIHAHFYRDTFAFTISNFASDFGIPYIIQPRGAMTLGTNHHFGKKLWDKVFSATVLNRAASVIALTEAERMEIISAGALSEKVEVIPNAFDADIYGGNPEKGKLRKKIGLSSEDPLILFFGRINQKKGLDILVQALARMKIQAYLAIVGGDDGDGHLGFVKKEIHRLNLEHRVFICGLWENKNTLEPLADADVFALTCRFDTFPMSVIEACAVGVPIVITDTCEIAGIVNHRSALVAPMEVDKIALAFDRILSDLELRNKLARAGRDVMETEFSTYALGNRLEALYTHIYAKSTHTIENNNEKHVKRIDD